MGRWPRTAAIRLCGLALGAASAGGVHWLVHGEHVDDGTGLALTGAVAIGLALALVGSVRTATRGFRRCGDRCLAFRLAGAVPPLILLLIGALFAKSSLIDTSIAMEALVDADRTQPAALAIGPGGGDVRLSGEITEGLADRLERLLAANPRVTRIHLTSDGGLADEGQAIGDVIAARGLATFVPDYCVSACTLAFARGRERLMMDDARLGYHAPYEQGLFGALYRDDTDGQRAAYLAAGLAPSFVDRALAVEPADIWFPTHAELLAAKVVTGIVDHDALPDSGLDGAATPAGARSLVLQNFPLLHPLAARRPAAMATIAELYLDGYRSGRSEGEDLRALRRLVRGAVASALVHADEVVMRDLGRILLRALAVADEPGACARIADEGDLAEAAAQLKPSDADAVAQAAGLLDRALRSDVAAYPLPPRGAQPLAMAGGSSCFERRRDLAAALASPRGTTMLRARLVASVVRTLPALPAPPTGRSSSRQAGPPRG